MLSKENFTEEHIRDLQTISKRDPALIERTIYAFGLLEAISRVGMPFIFKGGTCLMLLLEHPMRLSTDIDIIVEPGTDVDMYIEKASHIFPFLHFEEQKRIGKNLIEKRHFKFTYQSPIKGNEIYILLDVLFESNHYTGIVQKEISNELLFTEGQPQMVTIPNANSILGDKMTAFAPHTIGIPLGAGKDMEVMKQMYDVCTLIDAFTDFEEVTATYKEIAETEIAYRGLNISDKDALMDTLMSAASISSRGIIGKSDYPMYVKGSKGLRTHIFTNDFSAEIAAKWATKIMCFAACMLTGVHFEKIQNPEEYKDKLFLDKQFASLKYLRKIDKEAYAYAIQADKILTERYKNE